MLPDIKTILFIADYNEPSAEAFRYAMILGVSQGADIHIVSIIPPLTPIAQSIADYYLEPGDKKRVHQDKQEFGHTEIKKRLQVFCDTQLGNCTSGDELAVDISVIEGDVGGMALKHALKIKADVIVIGATEDLALSQSTLAILKKTRIPVLYVPL
jgi:nucleotide-binding universal stress UspA family protein